MTYRNWLAPFLDFIGHLSIMSKEIENTESNAVPLLDVMYGAQHRFLREVSAGLDDGIHSFVNLKSRQMGISTICLAIDCFWLTIHPQMQGALICDTESNKENFRILLEHYLTSLPIGLRVPIRAHNRNVLHLKNGSTLSYLVAGTKKGNAGLGRSRGLNFVHATEVSSWGSHEGVSSLQASLAQRHPHRLYIWESTAKGYNLFRDMWKDAQADSLTQRAFFIGWWSKEVYSFSNTTREFEMYWDGQLTPEESELCDIVKDEYDFEVKPEQIAWYRWMGAVKIPDPDMMQQEFPWHEEQAFIQTGKSFFPLRRVVEDKRFILDEKIPLRAYQYRMGDNFLATELDPVDSTHDADLRVWEEPNANAIYAMGIDPAYGRSDESDRHCIEVYRCYSDKLVQVAEYCTSVPETYQVAWVMCHLAGAYKNCWLNLEVTGPGFAVMQELRHLKQLLNSGVLSSASTAADPEVFDHVRWYLYHRPDSMGAGFVYNWKTNQDNKLQILNQLRDSYTLRQVRVRSVPLLDEMSYMVQDGGSINASGREHDDRVIASALAIKTWIDWIRPSMIERGYTYDKVTAEEMQARDHPEMSMYTYVVQDFFKQQEDARERRRELAAWSGADWDA